MCNLLSFDVFYLNLCVHFSGSYINKLFWHKQMQQMLMISIKYVLIVGSFRNIWDYSICRYYYIYSIANVLLGLSGIHCQQTLWTGLSACILYPSNWCCHLKNNNEKNAFDLFSCNFFSGCPLLHNVYKNMPVDMQMFKNFIYIFIKFEIGTEKHIPLMWVFFPGCGHHGIPIFGIEE